MKDGMRNGIPLSQRLLFSAVFVFIASFRTVYPLGVSTSPQRQSTALAGDWAVQKSLLRETDCCVVSVSGLESHLKVLQEELMRIKARPALNSFGIWMLGPALLEYGTEEQKMEHIPQIVKGEIRW